MVENTATNSNMIPLGEAVKLKLRSKIITITPKNEMMIPNILKIESFSFSKKYAKTGVITGMVAIITEATVDETSLNPKFSPKKYNKGSNMADIKNNV